MRILIAHSFYRVPGGEDRYVRQQAGLLADGHDVHLLTSRNESLGSRVDAGHRMMYSRPLRREVRKEISSFRPDVIHLHNAYPSLGPAIHLVAAELGIPLVMTVHNYRLRCPNALMFTNGSICSRCVKGSYYNAVVHSCLPTKGQAATYASALWWHRFVLRLEDKVALFICPSEFVSKKLAEWGVEAGRVQVIRNFTDTEPDRDSVPGNYGVYAGRLSREKGLDALLEALRRAGDPPFRILGDGPDEQRLHDRKSALGLANTEFAGRVPPEEIKQHLRRARFLALPSLCHENAPLAALEAMACGCALLVSDLGGLPELAGDGRGMICSPGDVNRLAECISSLMKDDEFCLTAGKASMDFVRAEALPDRHRHCLERAYAGLLTNRGRVSSPTPAESPFHSRPP